MCCRSFQEELFVGRKLEVAGAVGEWEVQVEHLLIL